VVVSLLSAISYFIQLRKPPDFIWSAYVYSDRDNGLAKKFIGTFSDQVQCQKQAKSALNEQIKLEIPGCVERACFADKYMCGLDCKVGTLFGGVFVSEIECKLKHIGGV
jgi:hypothetical protein